MKHQRFLMLPMPYFLEVVAWEAFFEAERYARWLEETLSEEREDTARLRKLLGGHLPTDHFDVSQIDGGELLRQLNDGLQTLATDIHRSPQIDEVRQLAVTIKGEPSENSAAVKWDYEVTPKLAKRKGTGVSYIDARGKLCPPQVDANQIMLPLNHKGGNHARRSSQAA